MKLQIFKTNWGYMVIDHDTDEPVPVDGDRLFDTHDQAQDAIDAYLMTFGTDADNGME